MKIFEKHRANFLAHHFLELLQITKNRVSPKPRTSPLTHSPSRGSSLLRTFLFRKWTRLAKTRRQSHLGLNKSWQTINFRCESRWYLSSDASSSDSTGIGTRWKHFTVFGRSFSEKKILKFFSLTSGPANYLHNLAVLSGFIIRFVHSRSPLWAGAKAI
jgi:hypothetical protein